MSRPQPFPGHAGTTAAPGLEFRYAAADTLPRQLADDRVLAVLGFGSSAPASDDPRWLRVPLQPLDDAPPPIEVWHARGPVRHGRDGEVAWASDGGLLFGAIEVDEGHAGIEDAAGRA